MKKLILLFTVLFAAGAMLAQNLSLSHPNGDPIEANSTLYYLGDPDQVDPITARINVTNNSGAVMNVFVKKVIAEGDTVTGSGNYFCWGVCFPSWVYISQLTVAIEAGATSEEFYGDYEPKTIPGKSTIMYTWWSEANPNDSVSVTVEYNASPTGINDPVVTAEVSKVYPNPASSYVSFDYSIPQNSGDAKIIISNILGARVMELQLSGSEGTKKVNVSDLTDGVYFYNLVTNDQLIETKKLIIRH